jgi:hypothetical protein
MGKYDKLTDFLKNSPGTVVTLSTTQIEKIIGEKLPHSAYVHRPWWANDRTHSQAIAWLNAGWEVDRVDNMNNASFNVTFRKTDEKTRNHPPPCTDDVKFGASASNPASNNDALSEDEMKKLLEVYLRENNWTPEIAWGKTRGIDIDARRRDERWIIEVKGSGSRSAMRVNYFIAILGELLQRMKDPNAKYSIALPNMEQFVKLWSKLPPVAKERTKISCLFVDANGKIVENSVCTTYQE